MLLTMAASMLLRFLMGWHLASLAVPRAFMRISIAYADLVPALVQRLVDAPVHLSMIVLHAL